MTWQAHLQLANEVRFARSHVKRELAAGQLTLADALDAPCCAGMKIGELCATQRGVGITKVRSILSRLMISETRAVRDLTDRQRAMLCDIQWPLRKPREKVMA